MVHYETSFEVEIGCPAFEGVYKRLEFGWQDVTPSTEGKNVTLGLNYEAMEPLAIDSLSDTDSKDSKNDKVCKTSSSDTEKKRLTAAHMTSSRIASASYHPQAQDDLFDLEDHKEEKGGNVNLDTIDSDPSERPRGWTYV